MTLHRKVHRPAQPGGGINHSPGSMPKARLKRALKFSSAMAVVNSTICTGESRSTRRRKSSSEIFAGVAVIASTYERISFSRSLKTRLSR